MKNKNTLLENAHKMIYGESDNTLNEGAMTPDILKKVLRVLETQGFSNWYNNEFEDYITGESDAKTQEEILDDLANLMLF